MPERGFHIARSSWVRTFAVEAAVVGLGALMLLAVVVANGRPTVFSDTNIYVWMGQMQLRPLRYALSPVVGGPASAAQDPDAQDERPAGMRLRRTEMAARSPWFGLTLVIVSAVGGLWSFAAFQSVAASYVVRSLWRAAEKGRALEHAGVMAALALGTTLPFFVGFAMPDVWAGIGLAALATLLFLPDALGRATKGALFLLLLAAMTFHRSNAIAAAPAVAVSVIAARSFWSVPWRRMAPGIGLFIASLAAASALQLGYGLVVKAQTGDDLRSPPFLAARALADGPGRTYLRRSCAQGVGWALCRFRDLPLDDSEDILWSGDARKGVFGRAGVDERIRIEREQSTFVINVVAFDPMGSAKAALADSWKTLISVNLKEPLRDPHFYLTDPNWRDSYVADLLHDLGSCGAHERGCRSRFDPQPLALWNGAVGLAALAWLALAAGIPSARRTILNQRLGPITLFLLVALACNAAATGILSGPFARYQARILWLLPLIALMAGRALLRDRRRLILPFK